MGDYIKRLIIAGIISLCVSLLFLGGSHPKASMLDGTLKKKFDWIWPADGVISDTYGTRQGKHKGIDIAGELNSPIFSVDDGIVEKSYYSSSYGNVIFIRHPSNFVTVYAHLSNRLVSEGQEVRKGKLIGKMGRTGEATGVHLHFETHEIKWTYEKKYALDPERLLGNTKIGEIVQAGSNNERMALEASTRMHSEDDDKNALFIRTQKLLEDEKRGLTYIVKIGDTLSSISEEKRIPVETIKKINNLSSELIRPKQVLKLHK